MTNSRPRVLIEDWLPVAELGIESKRERKVFTDLPPLNYLHVWWARRPIVASQAVVLGGLLPTWTVELANQFPGDEPLSTRDSYRDWFLKLVGILGDPVAAARQEAAGIAKGIKAFGYSQAWKNSPTVSDLSLLHRLLIHTWGAIPTVADPTAGGGSIPFSAARYGLPTVANDLNSIAVSVINGGVKYPNDYGDSVSEAADAFANRLAERLENRLRPFFPVEQGAEIAEYLYAYEIDCPRTGRPIPLLPNLWLDKANPKAAISIEVSEESYELRVIEGPEFNFDPSKGTMKGGSAVSPYDDITIDGTYIKSEAQAGRMRPIMYAVGWRAAGRPGKRPGPLTFRTPSDLEQRALDCASQEVLARIDEWIRFDLVPSEDIPDVSNYNRGHRLYGINNWRSMFTDRQLLTHVTFVELYLEIIEEVRAECGEYTEAVLNLITLMHGKMLDYNSRMSAWNISQRSVQHAFESHNFSFKTTFAEKMTPGPLLRWASAQVTKASRVSSGLLQQSRGERKSEILVFQGNAASIPKVETGSISHICIDPPYYDNVMYGELSDYFYVWHKRTWGKIVPAIFTQELADVDNEAVANYARFASMGRRKSELADADYEAKMTAIFAECNRMLRDDGVLSVMFTHKRAEAWDTLGMGLLQAGLIIETSWPVNTEFEFSFHQANMNSAASTIMLVCRKRGTSPSSARVYLEDIESEIRSAARTAAQRFQHDGIDGVDLLLSTYGPTLSVISQNWPVYSSVPDAEGKDQLLRPEDALDLAREEVVQLRRSRLVGKAAHVDDLTDFVLLAWDIFGSREFPYDTARLLALAVGGAEVDYLERAKIVKKKAGNVTLLEPNERLRHDGDSKLPGVRPEATSFEFMIDAIDTALYIADVDGMPAAKRFLDRHGFTTDSGFISTAQGLVNAIPRTKVKGAWAIPEAGLLDTLCTLYFPTVALPESEDLAAAAVQASLFEND
ncbi:DUF1156 domain-containing protein [Dietzia sp. WMMA184]|uniref:DUF1156 domain-containing protein n=1 Tax=Dietzia sp. WMMA184 TaxID=2039808 RepID=UPI000BDF6754|nr:DUF1156 domain-containing protein [Dietzia sp. WMMA184]